jgi:TPR repeat protein
LEPPVYPQQSAAYELFKIGQAALTAKKYDEAIRWLRQAVNKGNEEINGFKDIGTSRRAANLIGSIYANGGQGVARDYSEAMRWFLLAADKGDTVAMENISILYVEGHGVPKDCQTARQWMEKAATASTKNDVGQIRYQAILQILRSRFGGRCQW